MLTSLRPVAAAAPQQTPTLFGFHADYLERSDDPDYPTPLPTIVNIWCRSLPEAQEQAPVIAARQPGFISFQGLERDPLYVIEDGLPRPLHRMAYHDAARYLAILAKQSGATTADEVIAFIAGLET